MWVMFNSYVSYATNYQRVPYTMDTAVMIQMYLVILGHVEHMVNRCENVKSMRSFSQQCTCELTIPGRLSCYLPNW